MAELKDLLVAGQTRLLGDTEATSLQIDTLKIPTSSNGSTFGLGTDGQVLKTNGTSIYWGSDTLAELMGSTAKGSNSVPIYWDGTKFATITSYDGNAATASTASKVQNTLSIQQNGGTATVFDGSTAKTINITASGVGALPSSTLYAGSSSAGGAATSANKVNTKLTVNYGTTKSFEYDGSTAKTLSIKQGSNITITGDSSGNITIAGTANTNYYPTTFAWTAGSTSGPTGTLSGSGMSDVSFPAIPAASASASGIVTTGAQTFAGDKTFNGAIIAASGNPTFNNLGIKFAKGRIGENSSSGLLGIFGGGSEIVIRPDSLTSNSTKGISISSAYLIPSVTKTMTLGTSSNKWTTVYATTFDGNATSASKLINSSAVDYAVGSATIPVYFADGVPTACTGESVFSALSWTVGTTSGPVLNATIAGKNRTSTIPSASASASGVVTTGSQTFAGNKTFTGTTVFSASKGFNFSGIQEASTDSSRPIWFSYNEQTGTPVYDNDFKYNPATNTVTLSSSTIQYNSTTGCLEITA